MFIEVISGNSDPEIKERLNDLRDICDEYNLSCSNKQHIKPPNTVIDKLFSNFFLRYQEKITPEHLAKLNHNNENSCGVMKLEDRKKLIQGMETIFKSQLENEKITLLKTYNDSKTATIRSDGSVLFQSFYKDIKPSYYGVVLHDTVYQLKRDTKSDQLLLEIQQGNLLEHDENPIFITTVDLQTGTVLSFDDKGPFNKKGCELQVKDNTIISEKEKSFTGLSNKLIIAADDISLLAEKIKETKNQR